jgi:hypothetical protein
MAFKNLALMLLLLGLTSCALGVRPLEEGRAAGRSLLDINITVPATSAPVPVSAVGGPPAPLTGPGVHNISCSYSGYPGSTPGGYAPGPLIINSPPGSPLTLAINNPPNTYPYYYNILGDSTALTIDNPKDGRYYHLIYTAKAGSTNTTHFYGGLVFDGTSPSTPWCTLDILFKPENLAPTPATGK